MEQSIEKRVNKNIEEQLKWLEEAFENNQHECKEVSKPKDAEGIVKGEHIGVYIFFDKKSKKPYYVGEGGCKRGGNRAFWERLHLQINNPMKRNNSGRVGNWGIKIQRKRGGDDEKIKKFIKENMNFCFRTFENCNDSLKFEAFCNGVLKPEFTD